MCITLNHDHPKSREPKKYGKGIAQSMLIRFLSWLMKINIGFMGEVWRCVLHAGKTEPEL